MSPRRPADLTRVPPSQLARVLELLGQAERVISRLGVEWHKGQAVVRLPAEGYPLLWIERDAVVQALELSDWVQRDAAALLNISPRVMHYKIHQFALQPPAGRKWRGKDR